MKRIIRRTALPFFSGLIILLLCGSCTLRAQKRQKEDIRSAHEEANARIERCLDEGSPCGLYINRIQTNTGEEPWAAVGNYTSTRDLWYSRDQSSEEERFQLVKVNTKTQRSSRKENEEYFFSSAGQLRFYHFQMGEGDGPLQEFWFYFSEGQLIDYQEELVAAEMEYRELSKEDAEKVVEKAKGLQNLLQATL